VHEDPVPDGGFLVKQGQADRVPDPGYLHSPDPEFRCGERIWRSGQSRSCGPNSATNMLLSDIGVAN
jgi:hypothetical protein